MPSTDASQLDLASRASCLQTAESGGPITIYSGQEAHLCGYTVRIQHPCCGGEEELLDKEVPLRRSTLLPSADSVSRSEKLAYGAKAIAWD